MSLIFFYFVKTIQVHKNQTDQPQKDIRKAKHFNTFIIKIFTYKTDYKHYLHNSKPGCLLRDKE